MGQAHANCGMIECVYVCRNIGSELGEKSLRLRLKPLPREEEGAVTRLVAVAAPTGEDAGVAGPGMGKMTTRMASEP